MDAAHRSHPTGHTPPPRPTPLLKALAAAALSTALICGCSLLNRDAAATWDLAPDQSLDAETTTFTALVTRLDCNSGVTGEVNDAEVEFTDTEVVITFTVSPRTPGDGDCQGNDPVRHEVDLPQALGDRALVDGQCASAEAEDTEPCRPDGVRYTP
jgi:hypothetical protein